MDLNQEPAAVALLAHHAHAILTVQKRRYLAGSTEERLLGRDHHHVGIGREELYDGVGIACCEP